VSSGLSGFWRSSFTRLTLALVAGVLAVMTIFAGHGAPALTTDKTDYFSGDTAIVTGSGFAPSANYDIPITRPDGTIVKGDGTFTAGWDTIQSGGSGGFVYNYKLDGIFGTYTVNVYPSP
jgi:hypothetical protein